MSNRKNALFTKSLIAVAVVSVSACSTTPRIPDYDLSRVGEGILNAGRTTADVSERAWNKTTYLLGFSDGETRGEDGLLLDEVDLALMEEDAVMPDNATIRPIIIQNATPTAQLDKSQTPTNEALALNDQTPTNAVGQTSAEDTVLLDSTNLDSANNASNDVIGVEDVVHEVASSETLWDIAKATTGDANNWHVLADVNNLGPGAAVFPGQQLVIPADLVKPDFDKLPADTQVADAEPRINTQDLTNGLPLDEESTAAEIASPAITTASSDTQNNSGSAAQSQSTSSEDVPGGMPFKLNDGETLWDFAKRTTGDATNWQAIAGQNNFSERQAVVVRAGQTIYVPEELVRSELSATQLTVPALKDKSLVSSAAATEGVAVTHAAEVALTATDESAIEATSELLADSSSALDETQPIKIVEATFKADESLKPVAVEAPTVELPTVSGANPSIAEIMVSGTYYPKAIYNDADFSSSLLMRVSPGTTLQVSKAMGSWFEVETDKGIGYVHQRDIK